MWFRKWWFVWWLLGIYFFRIFAKPECKKYIENGYYYYVRESDLSQIDRPNISNVNKAKTIVFNSPLSNCLRPTRQSRQSFINIHCKHSFILRRTPFFYTRKTVPTMIEPDNLQTVTHLATVNPRDNDLAETIWWATLTIELPHAAPAPLKPSSVPNGFGGCLTLSIVSSRKNRNRFFCFTNPLNFNSIPMHLNADVNCYRDLYCSRTFCTVPCVAPL